MNQAPPPTSELTLAATPNAVAWARRHTVDILRRWRFPDEGIEVARLLVSELATNAIQHARPAETSRTMNIGFAGPSTIVLRLWPTDEGIALSVSDRDPQPPTPRTSDNSTTGGRGLFLVEAMAIRWGCYPTRLHPGKIVWAEVPTKPKAIISEPGADSHGITPLMTGRVLAGLHDL